MDTETRTFMIRSRIEERSRAAAAEPLAREARARGADDRRVRRGRGRHGTLRVALAAIALVVAAVSVRPPAAGAWVPGGSILVDPWLPLAVAVKGATTTRWDRAGLPHPTARVPSGPDGLWVRGTGSCIGLTCRWDLDDDRLDGTVAVGTPAPCTRPSAGTIPTAECTGGRISLDGPAGRWVGSWSSFRPGDRLVVMAGTGALDGLAFVGHWVRPGTRTGRVIGIVTRDRGPMMLIWPMPSL